MVTNADEREVSLAWMTGFNGHTPILNIVVDVFPEGGQPFERIFPGNVNMGTIDNLLPFREYIFSVAVVNLVAPVLDSTLVPGLSHSVCIHMHDI